MTSRAEGAELHRICGTPPFWTGSRVPPGASNITRLGAKSIAPCAFVAEIIRSNVPGAEYSANGATNPALTDKSPPMPVGVVPPFETSH